MVHKSLTIPIMAGIIAFSSCNSEKKEMNYNQKLDVENLNSAIKPQQDFYDYATGGWRAKNPLKPEFSRYGSFDMLRENNKEQLKTLIEQIAKSDNEKGSLAYKIASVYNAGLDAEAVNKNGIKELTPYFNMIDDSKNLNQLSKTIGELHKIGERSEEHTSELQSHSEI